MGNTPLFELNELIRYYSDWHHCSRREAMAIIFNDLLALSAEPD